MAFKQHIETRLFYRRWEKNRRDNDLASFSGEDHIEVVVILTISLEFAG